jgi:uncharacterized protein (DUF1697 family)
VARYVAFLRGINVGTAKRVAMADLKSLTLELGYTDVATVLNSGNLLFSAKSKDPVKLAAALKASIARTCKVDCAVMVVPAEILQHAVASNPLKQAIKNPSRFLVAFANDVRALSIAQTMEKEEWLPDQIAVDSKVIYLWCEEGVLDSPLSKAFTKHMKELVTTRNWTTLQKVCALL